MSDFQWAMCQAGVITQEEYQQQKKQEEQDQVRAIQVVHPEGLDFYCSSQSFMDWVRGELEKTPTPRQVKECIDKIRQVSLDQHQRTRISAFLKMIHAGLAGRPLKQRHQYLGAVWIKNW